MTGLDIRRDLVMVDICCNDPDNGLFAYVAEQIQIGDQLIELEPRSIRAPRFVDLQDRFRLAGKVWAFDSVKEWVGNWCWNGYWMPIPEVVRFLDWLHRRRLFQCTTGETRIYNMWKNSAGFDDEDRRFLWRMLGKPSNHHAAA